VSRHWANIGEAGALSGLRFMAWVYRCLGRTAFNVILVPVMFYYVLRRPIARRASRQYLLRVKDRFPDALPGRVTMFTTYMHFFRFGQSLLDKFVAWIEPPTDIAMDERQREQLYALVDSGKGCLMIGSHFGNLEYSRGIAHRHPDLVINVLIHDKHAQNFAALLSGAAPQSRLNLIQVTDLDLDLALRLKQKVDAGEWLLIAGDRVPVGEGDNVCEASFLGHAARFPVGPYVLASLLKCPVYLLHCFSVDGEYRLEIEKFADEIRPSRINQRRSWTAEAQRFSDALERQVGKAPLQWFNFFDFWGQGRNSAAQGNAELRHSAKI
jgi:predicted LPLAT superfamily acyltransferase